LTTPTFSDFALRPALQRAIAEEQYTAPTPIQAKAIPVLLDGRDLLGCSQTGTGKTAAFALPILNHLDTNRRAAQPKAPRVLVLAPTRELATQIGDSFATYGRHVQFRQTVIVGGVNQNPQVRALARGVHILIATPGRLLDLMGQGFVQLDQLEIFVVDEADRMLDLGFIPDLKKIIASLPAKRQSIFFSATMPPKVAELAESLLSTPVCVEATPVSSTVDRIVQRVMYVSQSDKRPLLDELLKQPGIDRVLIFTRTKRRADAVARQLQRNGLKADAIHGDKSQTARNRILAGFRSGRVPVLVATDLAARGIDVEGISHVINFDLPDEPESYVHRIGRTGRAGASGIALTFCDAEEQKLLKAIEKVIQRTLDVDTKHAWHAEPSAQVSRRPASSKPGGRRSGGGKPAFSKRSGSGSAPRSSDGSRGESGSQGGRAKRNGPPRSRRRFARQSS